MTNIIRAIELQEIRRRCYDNLIRYYDEETARKTAYSIAKVTAYYNGEPVQAETAEGHIMFIG